MASHGLAVILVLFASITNKQFDLQCTKHNCRQRGPTNVPVLEKFPFYGNRQFIKEFTIPATHLHTQHKQQYTTITFVKDTR